ncbi:hypothetical protein M3Y94_00494400 [Aphelenchoides besseyi]|nr:hypothetical protein M3Y94_00494400 [Aphelenchoides besseyi]
MSNKNDRPSPNPSSGRRPISKLIPRRVMSLEDKERPESDSSTSGTSLEEEEELEEGQEILSPIDTVHNSFVDEMIVRLMSAPLKPDAKARGTGRKGQYAPLASVKLEFSELQRLCDLAIGSLSKQPSLLKITEEQLPITICGDLHGQFKDLRDIFFRCGPPYIQSYLFLGDYVDRGVQSIEVISLLLALKIKYPTKVFLLRGNHEDANTCSSYGFYDECINRFMETEDSKGEQIWQKFIEVFNWLPLAALINKSILCMHGGISPHLRSLSDIDKIKRPSIIPPYGLMCDLVWADPEEKLPGWSMNSRGISLAFSDDILETLCERLSIDLIVRGHQLKREMGKNGYYFFGKGRLLTIFSAPNYLNTQNSASVLRVNKKMKCRFIVFRVYRRGRRFGRR